MGQPYQFRQDPNQTYGAGFINRGLVNGPAAFKKAYMSTYGGGAGSAGGGAAGGAGALSAMGGSGAASGPTAAGGASQGGGTITTIGGGQGLSSAGPGVDATGQNIPAGSSQTRPISSGKPGASMSDMSKPESTGPHGEITSAAEYAPNQSLFGHTLSQGKQNAENFTASQSPVAPAQNNLTPPSLSPAQAMGKPMAVSPIQNPVTTNQQASPSNPIAGQQYQHAIGPVAGNRQELTKRYQQAQAMNDTVTMEYLRSLGYQAQ